LPEATEELAAEDRAWLIARLTEYQELLLYLHDRCSDRRFALAVAINRAVRHKDEWFDEPDDLDRLGWALAAIDVVEEAVEAVARLAFRVTRAQAFGEGNKRTALLLARWILDRNGQDGFCPFCRPMTMRWPSCLSRQPPVKTWRPNW
jgi:hypothetical protein